MLVPDCCLDFGMCGIFVWQKLSGFMGAHGTGLSWPVYYSQEMDGRIWGGGPNLGLAGFSYSDGIGTNGDEVYESFLEGGVTADGGYVRLDDDSDLEKSGDYGQLILNRTPT